MSPCEGARMTTFVIDAQVAVNLAIEGSTIPPAHSLAAPTLLRSQAPALVYGSVQRGEIDERTGRKILDDIRGLRIRLLGDRVLQDHAWRIAAELNWSDTYQAEYIALTQLQADALATADRKLAAAAVTRGRERTCGTPPRRRAPGPPSAHYESVSHERPMAEHAES